MKATTFSDARASGYRAGCRPAGLLDLEVGAHEPQRMGVGPLGVA